MDADVDAMPIPGLRYAGGYLDGDAQTRLLAEVDSQPWQHSGGRSVQIYGYSYHFERRHLPSWRSACVGARCAARIQRDGLMPHLADQMIVNAYEAGAGISAHIDLSVFDDAIVAISLGSTCVMQFADKTSGCEEECWSSPAAPCENVRPVAQSRARARAARFVDLPPDAVHVRNVHVVTKLRVG